MGGNLSCISLQISNFNAFIALNILSTGVLETESNVGIYVNISNN